MSLPPLQSGAIAGLPWTAWLLWILSTALGLAVVLVFYFKYRNLPNRTSDHEGREI